jgi:hypothetical protein
MSTTSITEVITIFQHKACNKIEKNEMDRACSAYGGEKRRIGLWWGNLRERDHLGDPGIDGRIVLRRICWKWDGRGHGLD